MTEEQLFAVLKAANAKADSKDGYHVLPDGATLSLYVAKGGASLNVSKIEAIKVDGAMVLAKTKKELFFVAREDVFGASLESPAPGQPARRAGFG